MSTERINIHVLATAKGFTAGQLTQFGVHNGQGGVVIPYYTADGQEYIRYQIRTAVDGKQTHRWSAGDAELIPYGLQRPIPYKKQFVWVVEGASDCWTLWLSKLPALGVPGDKCASCLKLAHVEDCTIVAVIQEPDEAGKRFPHRVAQVLYDQGFAGEVCAVVLPHKDAREAAMHCTTSAEFRAMLATAYRTRRAIPRTTMKLPNINVRLLSSVKPEPVRWLWNLRLVEGPNVLAGDGGEGKSFVTNGLAAAFTTGAALPGGSIGEPIDVLMWNAEDSPEQTIRARAEACGANLDRIHILDDVNEAGVRVPFGLRHINYLSEYLDAHPGIRFVSLDPITALLADTDGHSDTEVRSALQPLVEVIRRHRAGLLTVMHLRKAETVRVLHRLNGSIAFGTLGRSVLYLGTHAVSGRKSVDTIKHNLAPSKPAPVEFAINEDGIVWVGIAYDLDAETIESSYTAAKRGNRSGNVLDFIRSLLANGPCDSAGIFAAASERGIGSTTLTAARKRLGIVAYRIGTGSTARWMWRMPGEQEADDAPRGMVIPIRATSATTEPQDDRQWVEDAKKWFDDVTAEQSPAVTTQEPLF